ncbi:MAG: LuxR C-terminal-related transcriptional regulator [Acidimicrobiales bacterium]
MVEQLSDAVERPFTVLVAPAGYGKSVAVELFVDSTPLRAVRVACDDDDDRVSGWRKVVAALRGAETQPGAAVGGPVSGKDDRSLLLALMEDASHIVEPTVVVVDDLHLVQDRVLFGQLEFLVNRLAPLLRIVAMTRQRPPLPLGLWQAKGRATEIGPDDLRFQPDEAVALFAARGSDLTREEVGLHNLWAEGWPLGMQVLAATGQQPLPGQPFDDRTTRCLVDHLFADQPAEVQEFVLATSVLGRFTADLCRAVTGRRDAGRLLQTVERANLFITTLDDPGWFRYRTLFAELMRWELDRRSPGVATELHRRAAAWHEGIGDAGGAVGHLATAGQVERAVALANDDRYLPWRDQAFVSTGWTSVLSSDWAEDDPVRMINYAMVLGRSGGLEQARRWIVRAEEALASRPADDPGHAALVAVRALWHGVHLDAERCIDGADAALPSLESDPGLDVLRQRLLVATFNCRLLLDEVDAAQRDCEALGRVRPTELVHDLTVPAMRARVELRRGHLRQAEALGRRVLRSAEWMGLLSHPAVRDAYRAVGGVLAERGRSAEAETHIDSAVESATSHGWLVVASAVRLDAIGMRVARTGPRAAAAELDDLRRSLQPVGRTDLLAQVDAMDARLRIALGDLGQADELVAAVPAGMERTMLAARLALARDDVPRAANLVATASPVWLRDRIGIELLAARVAAAGGEVAERDAHLLTAVRLAEPEGYVETFRGEPELRWRLRELVGGHPDVAAVGVAVDRPATGTARVVPTDELTEREAAVLRYLPSWSTNREIAAKLDISANTMKTHLRSVYRKLGVRSRSDAVAAARRAGLL